MSRTPLLISRPELLDNLVKALQGGVTIVDACGMDDVGIDESTFYNWQRRGRDALDVINNGGIVAESEYVYVEFCQSVTRAIARARIGATATIVSAIKGQETRTVTTETYTETRINKFTGEEYDYVRTIKKETVSKAPGDWRAALEYLKRRDPERWSADVNLRVKDWHSEVIEYVKRGEITFAVLEEEMGSDLATELFAAAGILIEDDKQEPGVAI